MLLLKEYSLEEEEEEEKYLKKKVKKNIFYLNHAEFAF